MSDMTLGEMLEAEQRRRELTQTAAAEMMDVAPFTFRRWTEGQFLPKSRHWAKIARFLRMPRDEVAAIVTREEAAAKGESEIAQLRASVERLTEVVERLLADQARPARRR